MWCICNLPHIKIAPFNTWISVKFDLFRQLFLQSHQHTYVFVRGSSRNSRKASISSVYTFMKLVKMLIKIYLRIKSKHAMHTCTTIIAHSKRMYIVTRLVQHQCAGSLQEVYFELKIWLKNLRRVKTSIILFWNFTFRNMQFLDSVHFNILT